MGYLITFGFIVFDFITGLISAFKNKEFNSSIMREGLFHKVALILCVILGIAVDYAQKFFDLGMNVPVASGICVFIILMEIGSSIENLGKINPDLIPEQVRQRFFKLNNERNDKK